MPNQPSDTIDRDTSKLWGEVRSLQGVIDTLKAFFEGKFREFEIMLHGVNGDNGIRGKLRELHEDHAETKQRLDVLDKDLSEARAWGQRIWEVERPANCIGSAEVSKLRAELRTKEEREDARDAEHRKLMYGMIGVIVAATLTATANIVVAIITLGAK